MGKSNVTYLIVTETKMAMTRTITESLRETTVHRMAITHTTIGGQILFVRFDVTDHLELI